VREIVRVKRESETNERLRKGKKEREFETDKTKEERKQKKYGGAQNEVGVRFGSDGYVGIRGGSEEAE
jgi:hypothetical protein